MSKKYLNKKKLKQNLSIKNYTYPLLVFLDKTNLLPFFQKFINKTLNVLKIKKQFNSELNYKIYGKIFKNAFENSNNEGKTILIPCFYPVNSTIFLRQQMLAKYLMDKGHHVLFIVCDGFFNICQIERDGKTRKDFKFLCHECSHHYQNIKDTTQLPIKFLSSYKNSFDSNLYEIESQKINQLVTLEACEKFVTADSIPLGEINHIGILRYYQKGKLDDNEKVIKVYKSYLKDTYRTYLIFKRIFSENDIFKTILWSGCSGHEKTVSYLSNSFGIDYITQEMFVGKNSWIYKKNGIAIHMVYYNDWLQERSQLNYSEENKQQILSLFNGMKTGKTFNVTYNDSKKKLAIDESKRYAVLFTNMNFDMYVLGRNPVFDSMKDWIKETIAFWKTNVKDITLIIRAHPGEIKLVTPSTDFVSDAVDISERDNIIFYDSDSDVNSYDLLNVADYVITYSSTIGVEALINDIPCISAGETMYQNFCKSPKSKENYFESILAYNRGEYQPIDKDNLLAYYHYLMFVNNVEVNGFSINRKIGQVIFDESVDNHKELISLNEKVLNGFYDKMIK